MKRAFAPIGVWLALTVAVSSERSCWGAEPGGEDLMHSLGPPTTLTNAIGIKLACLPASEFIRGSDRKEIDRLVEDFPKAKYEDFADEYPAHRVRITKPFYLGVHEVTVGQFRRFVAATAYKTDGEKDGEGGSGWNAEKGENEGRNPKYTWRNPGFVQTDEHPVVNVSWHDAVAFCEWLSRKEGETYRLPTEAEWEYACRAGTATRYQTGDDPETLVTAGNVEDGTWKEKYSDWMTIKARDGYLFTAPVGRFRPNAFGLYDLHGNVWEWCADWYDKAYYANSPPDDPAGPPQGRFRVFRGGGWNGEAVGCRSAFRGRCWPWDRSNMLGFRVARRPSGK